MTYKEWEAAVPEVTKGDALLTRIIQLLLVAIPQQRQHTLKETGILYQTEPVVAGVEPDLLLENIPLPDDV